MYLYILGREKHLCLAELESKDQNIKLVNEQVAISDSKFSINELGGTIKIAEIISDNISSLKDLQLKIIEYCKDTQPDTKFSYGISYYGSSRIKFNQMGIRLKKDLKQLGIKPRFVISKDGNSLNAASIKHNKLTTKGRDFVVVQSKDRMTLARSIEYQDIDSYSKRDYEKPCRDRKVGMLPPKLSQILINLSQTKITSTIFDPFCGSAGLLMESALMGYNSLGSDLSQDMIDCSNKNIDWFLENYNVTADIEILDASDATKINYPQKPYSIVTEGYLGTNFLSKPTRQLVNEQLPSLSRLYTDFFKNILKQPLLPESICICVPFWRFGDHTIKLNIIDEIANLGYTTLEFKSARQSILEYFREGQFTGRQIVVFKPNKEN